MIVLLQDSAAKRNGARAVMDIYLGIINIKIAVKIWAVKLVLAIFLIMDLYGPIGTRVLHVEKNVSQKCVFAIMADSLAVILILIVITSKGLKMKKNILFLFGMSVFSISFACEATDWSVCKADLVATGCATKSDDHEKHECLEKAPKTKVSKACAEMNEKLEGTFSKKHHK
jgi:hypothetical protein